MKNVVVFLAFILFSSVLFSQESGVRLLKSKSEKFIHTDFIGLGGKLVYIDNLGREIPLTIDYSTIFINNNTISSSPQYYLPTASTTTLGGVKVDGTSIVINNGVISTYSESDTPQTLSGTTPTFNYNNGKNAIITLSGNTTITMQNIPPGKSGSLVVRNPSNYTLNVTGYTNAIGKAIGTINNYTKLNTTGTTNTVDKFSYSYQGLLFWNGNLDYITTP